LVAAIALQRISVRNLRKGQRAHPAAAAKLLEHPMQDRTECRKYIFLGDERHLDIELIVLARRAVGAARLVAEARRDLKIAVETGHHQQLLELLRRLRQGVKFSGMKAARDKKVARSLGRAGGQDRRLKLGEALLDHPASDRGDDI